MRRALAARGEPRLLPGGAGGTWLAGDVVLKPAADPRLAAWTADVFDRLRGPGFRLPRPRRAEDGGWLVEGWEAWEGVDAEPGRARAPARAGRRLPRLPPRPRLGAAPGLAGPAHRPWIVGDGVAWDEMSIEVAPRSRPWWRSSPPRGGRSTCPDS